jgi:O-acetyl-ADP-ribose deacetylase (regulator of RNase III)/uncharacterized protein YwgA
MSGITTRVGDLFESEAQTLVNTVNTVGVMGKGIALGFKQRFPDMYKDYVRRCENQEVKLGQPYLFKSLMTPWIINFPTKGHWRTPSRLEAIREGIAHLADHYREWGIESLAVPPLGCGEGGLEWRIVGPTLYRGLTELDIPVELYAPFGTSPEELLPGFLSYAGEDESSSLRISPAWVALAIVIERITSQRYHYPIGRVSRQKIAYFATKAGLPTGLTFEQRSYGPYAPKSKGMFTNLINNGLIEEHRQGRMFITRPGPTLEDAEARFASDLAKWGPLVEKVADLFLRLPSTRTAELVSTVHYIADQLDERERNRGILTTASEIIERVRRWKSRFRDEEITGAIQTLAFLGWIEGRLLKEAVELDAATRSAHGVKVVN